MDPLQGITFARFEQSQCHSLDKEQYLLSIPFYVHAYCSQVRQIMHHVVIAHPNSIANGRPLMGFFTGIQARMIVGHRV